MWWRDVMTSCHDVTKPDLPISTCRCARKLILFLFPWFLWSLSSWMLLVFHVYDDIQMMTWCHDVMSLRHKTIFTIGTEAEIQLPLKRSSRFQRLFPNPSWLVWGRASRHQKLAPTFPGIDSCLMVTKRDFLEMEASLWLNGKSRNVAKGWLST